MKNSKGIITALMTPFDKEDRVNYKELERLVKFNLDMGVSGFYVCGSTGEAFMLTRDERMEIMRCVKDCAGDAYLIAHIGALDQRDSKALGREAKALSYDLVSSVAPFYFKFSPDEIKEHYFTLANESELPMLVYHIPALSGVNMGKDDMGAFLSDDRFAGIKFTSNDFFLLERCKSAYPDKVIYNGYDEMFLSGLIMGADGAIGSTYNFIGDKFVKIQELFKKGENAKALEIQREANEIIAVLCKIGVIKAQKEVMKLMGFDLGFCRAPFGKVSDEDIKLIKTDIMKYLV